MIAASKADSHPSFLREQGLDFWQKFNTPAAFFQKFTGLFLPGWYRRYTETSFSKGKPALPAYNRRRSHRKRSRSRTCLMD